MASIQAIRTEIAGLLDGLGAQTYDYLPGSAQLPALVVGLPDTLDPYVSNSYWLVDLPVYVVTRSAEPLSGETSLLDLVVTVVATLKANRTGVSYSSLRVVDITNLDPIEIGTVDAHSAQVNVSVMVPTPTI